MPPAPPPSICRSCLHRIQTFSRRQRQFSTTSTTLKHGALPTFTETSSPELSSILSTFRSNVFLPAHLLTLQRNLIYRPKNIPLLTNPDEPATVRIGNEVLPLKPLNHLRDEPATRKSIVRILELMKTGQDWSNLPGFLEGLKIAKRKLKDKQLEKIVRRAGEEGRLGIVMECARRVEDTGLGMGKLGVVSEVMWAIVDRVNSTSASEKGGWNDSKALDEAAKTVMAVWEMTREQEHNKLRKDNSKSPRRAPEIVGVVLQVLAARALIQPSSMSPTMKAEVEKFARRLVRLPLDKTSHKPDSPTTIDNAPTDAVDEKPDPATVNARSKLLRHAPIWHALSLAKRLFQEDKKLLGRLSVKQDQVEDVIEDAVRTIGETGDGTESRAQSMWARLRSVEIS